jgi:hypothetical protein
MKEVTRLIRAATPRTSKSVIGDTRYMPYEIGGKLMG